MSLKSPPGIVPALDTSLGKALIYTDRLKGLENEITGLKIGSDIVDKYGFLVARNLFDDIETNFEFIVDLQKRGTDIPDQIEKQVKDAASLMKCQAYISSPLGAGSSEGLDEDKIGSLEAFVNACKEYKIEPVVVLEMTQPGSLYFARDGASEELAKISMRLGVKYFVAPATRPQRIEVYRDIIGENGEIISPGSGPQKTGDVVTDASNAVKAGADHLVIGRGLLRADDPIDTGKRIYEAAMNAYQAR